ncbi:MAG: hypothetical protein WAK60_09665 [Sedimentisphaerales bacterium]
MNKAIWFFLPLLLLFSQGCVTFPVVGSFDEYNETFKGTVTASLFTGTSGINIEGVDGKTHGKGSSWMTYMPPSLNCEGTKGDVLLTFSDGRVVNAEFFCLSCSSGWGSGKDQSGNIFRFTFGMSNEEAEKFIEKTKNVMADRPSPPPAYEPEGTRRRHRFSSIFTSLEEAIALEPAGEELPRHSQEIAKSDIPPKAPPPVEFEYNAETKMGYISVKGKGPEARSWMLKQIEEICASKNIIIQEGTTPEPAHFRILSETFLDGKFTMKFEVVR